ncbi:MAG: hypothetical protein JJE21_07675, partial [Spirochaetaceae bacterium]|nr:hypothetical protein [Spirochaetaceae bacterium]
MVLDIFDTELDISAELINELKKVLESDSSNSKTISFTSQRHIIAYQISLYTLSILNQFIKHVDKENLLDCLENSKLSSLNRKNLEVIYKSFHSLTNAMAIKNYSFAMRIINTLCQTITVSIALNEKDKRGNYSVFEAYLDEKKRTTFELNEGYSEIEYLEKFMDYFSDFDKRNFLNTPDFSEFDNSYHSWLYKYFLIKDPKHKFVKFQSPITESIKFITYQDVDKVITKGYQNYSLDFSSSYLTNNFGDFYFDSISPVTGGYEFPLIYDPFEDKGNFIPLINNMEIQCVHSIIDTINYLPYYFESIPSLVSLTVIFEKYIRIIFDEFYDSEELSYNSEKEAVEIIERESFNYMTRNKDTMVMKMILGKQKITSNKDKEVINKYFTNYKNNFLNNNDVSIKVIESSQIETSSVNLSIKYLNLFKSIENAYWYRAGDVIPSCLPLGEYEDRIDDLSDFDDKLIFVGGKESGRNEKFLTNIFFERKVMSFFNICNSLIIGDSLNALREVKKLYESIISNLYIVFKEFDEDGSKNNLDKLIPSLLIYIDNSFVNSHRGVDTWRDVRKIFSKIIIDNKDASNDMNNLSDDKLDELTANAFEELFENHELSNYIEEEEEESLKNLVFDEKELIKAMEGDDEGFKKYLNKFAQFKNS